MAAKVIKDSDFKHTVVDSIRRTTLNYTDIVSNNNKYYSAEIVKASDDGFYIFTTYGRVAAPNPAKEYRAFGSQSEAEKEFDKIIKSKIKKGYVEVLLAKSEVCSEIGKSKVSASSITEDTAKKLGFEIKEENQSSLHPAIQSVVRSWFGSIEQFIVNTLDTSKCALGQLRPISKKIFRNMITQIWFGRR